MNRSAADYAALVDAARDLQRRLFNSAQRVPPTTSSQTLIRVRNVSGADVDRYGILSLDAPCILPADDAAEFLTGMLLDGIAPVAGSPFVVTVEPIAADEIGQAVVAGATFALVAAGDGSDLADVLPGESGYLQCSASGPARILWRDVSGTDWAIIQLGAGEKFQAAGEPGAIAGPGLRYVTDADDAAITVPGWQVWLATGESGPLPLQFNATGEVYVAMGDGLKVDAAGSLAVDLDPLVGGLVFNGSQIRLDVSAPFIVSVGGVPCPLTLALRNGITVTDGWLELEDIAATESFTVDGVTFNIDAYGRVKAAP